MEANRKFAHLPITASYDRMYKELRAVLTALTQNPEFLPQGGMLGFRLKHQYTVPPKALGWGIRRRDELKMQKPLMSLIDSLKGSDAIIYKVCEDLNLTALLKFIYEDKSKSWRPLQQMCDIGLSFDDHTGYGYSGARDDLKKTGQPVSESCNFTWVRKKLSGESCGTTLKLPYPVYDTFSHKEEVRYAFGKLTLVVWIGPPSGRECFNTDWQEAGDHNAKRRRMI